VIRTRVGYAGGTTKDPTYYHLGDYTETVQIDYDPSKITYRQLLDVFWSGHEPSRSAWSRQYAAIIFYHDAEQKKLADETKSEVAAATGQPVRTEIVPFREFYLAEDYHQKHALRLNREFLEEMRAYYPDARSLTDSTAAARLNGYLGGEGTYENLQVELDDLGLSPARRESLRALVGRNRTRAGCPVRP
jgi:peptide-methionine (S)-S-oxide reductase